MGYSSGRSTNHSGDGQGVELAAAIARGFAIRPSKSWKYVVAHRVIHFGKTIEAATRCKLLCSIGIRAGIVHRSGFAQVDNKPGDKWRGAILGLEWRSTANWRLFAEPKPRS